MNTEKTVRRILQSKKRYEAKKEFLDGLGPEYRDESYEKEMKKMKMVIHLIESWLIRLRADEQFVVEYHLIHGYDWDRIVDEHRRRWGDKGRCNRTLRYYQQSAIRKITLMVQETPKICQQILEELDL